MAKKTVITLSTMRQLENNQESNSEWEAEILLQGLRSMVCNWSSAEKGRAVDSTHGWSINTIVGEWEEVFSSKGICWSHRRVQEVTKEQWDHESILQSVVRDIECGWEVCEGERTQAKNSSDLWDWFFSAWHSCSLVGRVRECRSVWALLFDIERMQLSTQGRHLRWRFGLENRAQASISRSEDPAVPHALFGKHQTSSSIFEPIQPIILFSMHWSNRCSLM